MARAAPRMLTGFGLVVVRRPGLASLDTLSRWFGWEGSTSFNRVNAPRDLRVAAAVASLTDGDLIAIFAAECEQTNIDSQRTWEPKES